MKPLLAPLIFAAFATITAPIALLLNTFNNRSSKLKKRNCCGRDFPISFFSSMAVGDLLAGGIGIPLSALVGLTSLPSYLRIAPVQPFCGMDVVTSMLMFALSSCSPIHLTIIA